MIHIARIAFGIPFSKSPGPPSHVGLIDIKMVLRLNKQAAMKPELNQIVSQP